MYSLVLMAALTTGGEVPDWGRRGCHGCWSCSYSCWSSCACWGCCGRWVPCGGCFGCYYGGYVYSSSAPARTYSYVPAGTSYAALPTSPSTASQEERATLIVHLPADAQLTVEGQPTQQTSARRLFVSPPLTPGKTYYYTLRAEVVRNGQKLTTTREVAVRAGQQTEVTLDLSTAATARR
jgi:uncharacterized protein (TIGR03000 family)